MHTILTNKVTLVTGVSSGIGREIAQLLAQRGARVFGTARNPKSAKPIPGVEIVRMDVTDDASVSEAIQGIVQKAGPVEVLVNNAGYGLTGALEETTLKEARDQFETNFFGVIRVTQQVLPIMRNLQNGGGSIVNVSSINGLVPFPVISAYVGTKFALEGLSESMSYELEPFGIKVILIEPGAIGSNFMKGSVLSKRALDPESPYSEFVQKVRVKISSDHENATQPEEVAKTIVQAILTEKPEFRYVVGSDALNLLEARKNMPYSEFQKMIIQNVKQ